MMGQTEKCEKLYEAITELPDELIAEAEEFLQEKEKSAAVTGRPAKKNSYFKWILAVAACLTLFCTGIVSGLWLAEGKETGELQQTKYEEEKQGFHFLVSNMAANNSNSIQMKPSNDGYFENDLYSNYLNTVTDNYTEISSLYMLYGITSGDRIEKVVYCAGNEAAQTVTITDKKNLQVFYELTLGLRRYSEGDFYDDVISKMSKEEIAKFHGDCRVLEITTTNGLVFTYSLYPKSGWLFCGSTMSFYVLGDEFLQWFQTYCEE